MVSDNQYLLINLGDASFLLASGRGVIVEPRERLAPDQHGGAVCAWRLAGTHRWPAIGLDRNLRARSLDSWQRAVFLETGPHPVGLAADDVQIVTHPVEVERFTPTGPAPTPSGHLFSGAWINEGQVVLRFEPGALAAFLCGLGAHA